MSVEGAVTYDKWEDPEGKKRIAARIVARDVGFLTDLREPAETR